MSNFHPLEVVCRGSETQLQVGEKFNYSIFQFSALRDNILLLNQMNVCNYLSENNTKH